ncbi:MAG: YabP/YqfC family sporulation protein [Roseburia sp.]|nr:YabP/YqfC family sporulation protein [Roseburia sp.]
MKKKILKPVSVQKENLIDTLKLPKDVCMGALSVTLTGNREAWIENYRGILEYTDKLILLQTKSCQVCFEGNRLSIDYYTNEDMKISGNICSVRYL